ncbi:MAG: hypothetical protein LBL47_00785 [Lactobacillus sp.]|jgi:hypothetical protein|nr:hypothetical protein [Lactobacillus sp.]
MTKARRIKYSFLAVCALIFLVILGVILSGPSKGVKVAASDLKELSTMIRSHYQNRPGYWGLNTDVVLINKIAPLKMLKDAKLISGTGRVMIGSGANGEIIMPGEKTFDVTFKDLNFKDCVDLVSFKFKEEHYLGLMNIKIVNDKGETLFDWGGENNIPAEKATAKEACSDKNDVVWSYE